MRNFKKIEVGSIRNTPFKASVSGLPCRQINAAILSTTIYFLQRKRSNPCGKGLKIIWYIIKIKSTTNYNPYIFLYGSNGTFKEQMINGLNITVNIHL